MTDSTGMGRPSTSDRGYPRTSEGRRPNSWMARRRRDDRGATLIEAAFVVPVFILVLFGIFEFSGYVTARTSANAALKAGARMATVSGQDSLADSAILAAMSREGAGLTQSQDRIEMIKVWHAKTTWEGPPPDWACYERGEPVSPVEDPDEFRECNLFRNPDAAGGAFEKAKLEKGDPDLATSREYWFGCEASQTAAVKAHKFDCGWPPSTRKDVARQPLYECVGDSDPLCKDPDLVGIYIRVDHGFYTGFFGDDVTLSKKTIGRIEPHKYRGSAG